MKTSRTFFSEVERRFDAMPFTLRLECKILHFAHCWTFPWQEVEIKCIILWCCQGFWGWGQSPSGSGRVCQTWAAATLQCTTWKRGWVFYFFVKHASRFLIGHQFLLIFFPLFFVFLGEFVAQFKFTVLLMANGPHRITTGPLNPEFYKSEHEVQDPELKVRVTALVKI